MIESVRERQREIYMIYRRMRVERTTFVGEKPKARERGENSMAEDPLHVDCFLHFNFLFFSRLFEVLGSAKDIFLFSLFFEVLGSANMQRGFVNGGDVVCESLFFGKWVCRYVNEYF